jgi:hypothetical protein
MQLFLCCVAYAGLAAALGVELPQKLRLRKSNCPDSHIVTLCMAVTYMLKERKKAAEAAFEGVLSSVAEKRVAEVLGTAQQYLPAGSAGVLDRVQQQLGGPAGVLAQLEEELEAQHASLVRQHFGCVTAEQLQQLLLVAVEVRI